MTIEIKGLDNFNTKISSFSKQLDYALSLTLNDLAFESREALNLNIKGALSVKAAVAKAYVVDRSSKKDLTSTVRMKSDWHKVVLSHHYTGGTSVPIMFEHAMQDRGYITNKNSIIPIKKITKAGYRKLLTQTKRGIAGRDHFVVGVNDKTKRTAHLEPGIYKRLKRKVRPVAIFTASSKYKKRLDMNTVVEKKVSRRINELFRKNMTKALRTAK